MIKLIKDINPRGMASVYTEAPFDQAKKALEKEGYRIISLEENARLRMQEGKDSIVSKIGNYTREGVLYLPDGKFYLTKNSPIMNNAEEATGCHRKNQEFYLTDKQIEQALEDSVQIIQKEIPVNRFKDDETTVFAFGSIAEQYGNFLKEYGINAMPIYLADQESKPFARQLWFMDLDLRSDFNGCGRDLGNVGRVRGVCNSGEATQKILDQYTKRLEAEKKLYHDNLRNLMERIEGELREK